MVVYAAIGLGVFVVLSGILLVVDPEILFGFIRRNKEATWLYIGAFAGRFVFGALLVLAAPASIYPLAMQLLGWFIIAAAAFILLMGRTRFVVFLDGSLKRIAPKGRLAGIMSIFLGGVIVYAFTGPY